MPDPVRYTPDVEQVRPDEAETVREIEATFDSILDTTSQDYGHAVRAVHAKAHAVLDATLTIDADLPPELAQGIFATPGAHRVAMRFSTNAGDVLDDAISLPRGVAIKIFDVAGERLPGAEGRTQDFIMVNGPVFQAKTADAFLGSLKLLARTTDRAEGAKKALSAMLRGVSTALGAVGIESAAINTLGGAPNVDPFGETFFSVTPFRYGDYIAKFSIVPVSPDLTMRTDAKIDPRGNPDAIRDTLRADSPGIDATWEFRVQLCRDPDAQPIEDPTVEWDEDAAPFRRVALLHAAPQDSWDAARVETIDEGMRFSVWTGLAAHRPLGNINRARRDPYRASADFRARFNGCPLHEPGARADA